jgi:hypothetical protein
MIPNEINETEISNEGVNFSIFAKNETSSTNTGTATKLKLLGNILT